MSTLQEQLFTIDQQIMTCSGGTAGIDLMLHLISESHGKQLASEITDQMIHYPIRTAEAKQRHTHGVNLTTVHPYVDEAIRIIEANITEPIKVEEVAKQVGISQRQLERYFKQYLNCSVVKFSQLMRLQYARVLLTSTTISIREVSAASGFNSMSHFSNAFLKCFGKKPSQYRLSWPEKRARPFMARHRFLNDPRHTMDNGRKNKSTPCQHFMQRMIVEKESNCGELIKKTFR